MFTVHPLKMGTSWKPGGGHSPPSTGEALLGVVALLLHPEEPASLHSKCKIALLLDEFLLAWKRCESLDEVISPLPLLFG